MNTNVVLAFVGGAVLASGIVYVAVKPAATPKVASVSMVTKPAAPAEPVAAPAPAPAEPVAPVVEAPAAPTAADKPSPMPPREHRGKPVRIAQARPPADEP